MIMFQNIRNIAKVKGFGFFFARVEFTPTSPTKEYFNVVLVGQTWQRFIVKLEGWRSTLESKRFRLSWKRMKHTRRKFKDVHWEVENAAGIFK